MILNNFSTLSSTTKLKISKNIKLSRNVVYVELKRQIWTMAETFTHFATLTLDA